jgi:hypothetical protein
MSWKAHRQIISRIAISAVAVLLIIGHVLIPRATLTDPVTIFLITVAILPWLRSVIKSVELLGVKVELLQELKAQATEHQGAVESANRQSELALSASTAPSRPAAQEFSSLSDIEALADEYDDERKTDSGVSRTGRMTDIIWRMIEVSQRVTTFDVSSALRSDSPGKRLFAYAYLYARPNCPNLSILVESVTAQENQPFGQYWGLQAIGRVMSRCEVVPPEVKSSLKAFAKALPPGTDRAYEAKRLLA